MKHSKTMPKGEAIPLGTKRKRTRRQIVERAIEIGRAIIRDLDTAPSSVVESLQVEALPPDHMTEQEKRMILTLRSLSKNGKNAMYVGAAAVLRLPLAAFPDKQAPTSIGVDDGIFASPKAKKVKLTKEERAALPKPTEAERIARAEINLAKRKAKLAASL